MVMCVWFLTCAPFCASVLFVGLLITRNVLRLSWQVSFCRCGPTQPRVAAEMKASWTSHKASTSTCWCFAFGAMFSYSHSNETHAPIANPPNSAQLEGTPYHSPELHPRPCSSVGMWWRTDRQTDTHTHTDGHGQYTFRLGYAARKM